MIRPSLYLVCSLFLCFSVATESQKAQAFQKAFSTDDLAFNYYVFEKFIGDHLSAELIKLDPPHLEEFLARAPFSLERYELLIEFLRYHERYDEAAYRLVQLARTK